jgi:hypothetical protein
MCMRRPSTYTINKPPTNTDASPKRLMLTRGEKRNDSYLKMHKQNLIYVYVTSIDINYTQTVNKHRCVTKTYNTNARGDSEVTFGA